MQPLSEKRAADQKQYKVEIEVCLKVLSQTAKRLLD